jgi:hypothetical protein
VPDAFRCELTPDRLDAGERELAAALALWATRTHEELRARRERLEPWVRGFGLAACAAGALLSAWAVASTPVDGCPAAAARSSGMFFQVATPLFAVLGVVFWFLPRVTAELRAWAPGAAARAAPRVLAPLRRGLPSEVSYELAGDRIVSRLSRPPRTARTAFGAVHGAVVGSRTACLFGRPPFGKLLRIVWLPGEEERRVVVAALEAAKVQVIALHAPASTITTPPGTRAASAAP